MNAISEFNCLSYKINKGIYKLQDGVLDFFHKWIKKHVFTYYTYNKVLTTNYIYI